MKTDKLIEELQKMPQNLDVCVADWRKHIHNADDEPNGIGIEPSFKVELIEGNGVPVPFIALSFENDDYDEDGERVDDGRFDSDNFDQEEVLNLIIWLQAYPTSKEFYKTEAKELLNQYKIARNVIVSKKIDFPLHICIHI